MSICIERDLNVFMSQSLFYHQWFNTLMDQISDMTVPEIMHTNSLYSCFFNMIFHFMLHCLSYHRKDSLIIWIFVQAINIIPDFIFKKFRNINRPNNA